jgi:hypothetical protein
MDPDARRSASASEMRVPDEVRCEGEEPVRPDIRKLDTRSGVLASAMSAMSDMRKVPPLTSARMSTSMSTPTSTHRSAREPLTSLSYVTYMSSHCHLIDFSF